MSIRAELYTAAPEDVELLARCYRPMRFATRRFDDPVDPMQARAWLAWCNPLLTRLGSHASERLLKNVAALREGQSGWELPKDATRRESQFSVNLNVHSLFEQLASEYMKHGFQPHEKERLTIPNEVTWDAFQLIHFDHKPLVPTWQRLPDEDPFYAFASAPIDHGPFGRLHVWRSAEHLRAFFPKFHFFRWKEGHLTPPSPQMLAELKDERGVWRASNSLWPLRSQISACQPEWDTLVELLRMAAQAGDAFISVSQDLTDYA